MASIPQIARKSWAYTATADGESAARGTGYLDIYYYTPVRRGASSSRSCRLDKFVLSTDSLDQMILLLLLLLQLRFIVLTLPAVNDDDDGETQRERRRRRRSRSTSITKTIQQLHDCDLHHCLDYRNPIFPPWHLLAVRIIEGSAAEADCDRLFTSIISLTKKKGRRRFFPLSLFFYLNSFFFFFLFVDTETQMQKTKEQRV